MQSSFCCPIYWTFAPKRGFCQGCEALVLPLTKTKLAIMKGSECVDYCRAHSLAEQYLTNDNGCTDNTSRAPKTEKGRPPPKGRQEADRNKALVPCVAEPLLWGEDLSRGVAPLMVVSYAVTFCRTAQRCGSLGRGDTERARENQGGKPRGGGLPCIRHIVTFVTSLKRGSTIDEDLSADGIRP